MLITPDARVVLEPKRATCMKDTYDFHKPVADVKPFAHLDGPYSVFVKIYVYAFDCV